MNDSNLNADDIRWVVQPVSRVECVDLLGLDERELFAYARDLQQELESVRLLLHEALTALVRANGQRDRALKTVVELREVVRKLQGAS